MRIPIEVVEVLASPLHRYDGRPADGPAAEAEQARADRIGIRAGLGVEGDRFFNRSAHRRASMTVMAVERLEELAAELGLDARPGLAETRRNVLLRGVDVDALAGRAFTIGQGEQVIRVLGHRPANPCAWMDVAIAPGGFRGLRGRGGVRCEPLSDGELRPGPAWLTIDD
jgi:MOSC domain-containing protein YiiM